LEPLESNGITMYIDPRLKEYLSEMGDIHIDYLSDNNYDGFHIRLNVGDCSDRCCS